MNTQLQIWLKQRNNTLCHRQLLVISTEQTCAIKTALSTITGDAQSAHLWVGDTNPHPKLIDSIQVKDYTQKLGQEYNSVIFNSYDGFRANAAIALSGTIKESGLMILLCPNFNEWPNFNDPENQNRISYGFNPPSHSNFIQHLIHAFNQDDSVAILTESNFIAPLAKVIPKHGEDRFKQQKEIVQAIKKVAIGHRNRPLVITADRGRGKSSALGLAAAQLIKDQQKTIYITAPHINAVKQVFYHAALNLPQASTVKNSLQYRAGSLLFKPVDTLLSEDISADMLLIDEAAAIPVELLQALTEKFSRLVFSTTQHGYEGSGRGFELRFKSKLATLKPEFRSMHIEQPIRWSTNDPLETFWFKTFLYKTPQAISPPVRQEAASSIECKFLPQNELGKHPELLSQIFTLLINAHYQTSSDDIQRLLDAPECKCFVAIQNNRVIAVAQCIEEGGEKLVDLSYHIACCEKRVKGHLVAQNLSATYNFANFSRCKQWRIGRIAVQPDLQKRGIASNLLEFIKLNAHEKSIDFLSAAYGCRPNLLKFWHSNLFNTVKLSSKVEVSSGEHNGMSIYALNSTAQAIEEFIKDQFALEILFQLDKDWKNIESDLIQEILTQYTEALNINSPESNIEFIKQFCLGQRNYSYCKRQIRGFILQNIDAIHCLTKQEQKLLISAILQLKPISELVSTTKLTGKKQLENTLKETIRKLLTNKKAR